MNRKLLTALLVSAVGFVTGCGPASDPSHQGPYFLDDSQEPAMQATVYYSNGKVTLERIGPDVCGLGWDGRYLVAMQNPHGDKMKTNYFFIDSQKDSATAAAKDVVIGPLSEAEYKAKEAELKLPSIDTFFAHASSHYP